MKTQNSARRLLNLPVARWTAYASASAATALAAVPAAEAAIHYSGPVDSVFNRDSVRHSFPLSGGANLVFRFVGSASEYYDAASFKVSGAAVSGNIRGLQSGVSLFAARLPAGARVSQGHFFPPRTNRYANFGEYYSLGNWARPGVGFIGFEFNTGSGRQYGWARMKTHGKPAYSFIVEDYAWGDPGDTITAGQTQAAQSATDVPASGSLGLLALGGAGMVAWRRARSRRATR